MIEIKKKNTSYRLKQIMNAKNLRQVDILNACKPYCDKYSVKFNKSDISQYVAGKSEPNQDKLYILSKALNVNPTWLMGYDVPQGIEELKLLEKQLSDEVKIIESIQVQYGTKTVELLENFTKLDEVDQIRILERIDTMLEDEKYSVKKESLNA